MTRLELLKQEKRAVQQLFCLSIDAKERSLKWYDDQIKAIEQHNTEDHEINMERYHDFLERTDYYES